MNADFLAAVFPISFLRRFILGFKTPLRGFQFIQKNKFLWTYLIAPMFLMMAFSIGFFLFMLNQLPYILSWMSLSNLWTPAYYILLVVSLVGFLLLSGIAGIFVSRLFTFPLYAFAAEKVLMKQGSLQKSNFDFKNWARQIWTLVSSSIGKTVFLGAVAILLFVFAFLPVLDVIIGMGASYLLALDCLDTPLELIHPHFKVRVAHWAYLTPELFGTACALALSLTIPGLSFIMVPSTIIGNCLLLSGLPLNESRATGDTNVTRSHS